MRARQILKKICKILPDKLYIMIQYRSIVGKKLKLKNPQTYTEKLQWIKLHDRKPEYTLMVDKYLVKDYVAKRIGEEYVVPLIGVWDSFDDISFSELPESFVLKANNSSGGNIICKSKTNLDIGVAKRIINGALRDNVFWYGREWPYKDVIPKIIAEEYLEDLSGGLQDYKVLCFNGEPRFIEFHSGRFTDDHIQNFYDFDWVKQDFNQVGEKGSTDNFEKPKCLEKMYELSKILSKDIRHVRVDWYEVGDRLYFGELTFFDASGYQEFVPEEINYQMGSLITI